MSMLRNDNTIRHTGEEMQGVLGRYGIFASGNGNGMTSNVAVVSTDLPPHDSSVTSGNSNKDKARTKGWWLFDALVYGVLNYPVNILLSVLMAYDMHQYKKGRIDKDKNIWNKTRSWFCESVVTFNEKISAPIAGWAVDKLLPDKSVWKFPGKEEDIDNLKGTVSGTVTGVFLLSWGGTFLIVPIKILENFKPKIVRFFDRNIDRMRKIFGGGPDEQELQERKQTYKRLDGEFRTESWLRLFWSRVTAIFWVSALALAFSAVDAPKGDDKGRKGLGRVKDWALNWLEKHDKSKGITREWRNDKEKSEMVNEVGGLAVIEAVATFTSSSWFFLKLKLREFMKKKKGKKDTEIVEIAEGSTVGITAADSEETKYSVTKLTEEEPLLKKRQQAIGGEDRRSRVQTHADKEQRRHEYEQLSR